MNKDILISSDDSDNETPKPAVTNLDSNKSTVKTKDKILLSHSDSDSDNKITSRQLRVRKDKTVKDEVMLGEVSLLTSDEEGDDYSPPKKKTRKINNQQEKFKLVKSDQALELLTSDDEYVPETKITKSKAPAKKRKLPEPDKKQDKSLSPPKRAKAPETTTKSPQVKKTAIRRKPAIVKATAKSSGTKQRVSLPDEDLDTSIDGINPTWNESVLLAERTQIDHEIALNLIKLWEEGNTIPFIARYRKNVIGNMTPEELRTTKEGYDEICNVKKKMCTVAKVVAQLGKLDNKLQGNICAARTIEELEYIYAPFKPESKGSLAERAKRCGLEEPALHLLNNTNMVNFTDYVKSDVKEVKTAEDVEKGIVHIIASEIATDPDMLKFLRDLRAKTIFTILTKKARQIKAKEKTSTDKVTKTNNTNNKKLAKKDPAAEELKFEMYFDYKLRVDYLKSHQILAINRGESLKILNVKIEHPKSFEYSFKNFCTKWWINKSMYDEKRKAILNTAIEDAFIRLISPLISREIRAELKQKAEKESCKVFSDNLKHLLLGEPMKGKSILGIDPGYTNGCKLALISSTGSLLGHAVVYPHNNKNQYRGEGVIKDMLLQHKCNLIAIGNGTACRQTEEWISQLISNKYFGNLDVQYTIVNEDGASIYSCSPEAKKEFGNLDPNIISAVSLARRIQDPMAELVKVEPSHLGIGMYQLDIKKKQLEEALDEVVSECVSFVGVDLNTASQCLLRRVAGLSDKKATQIIDHRQREGAFIHRRELLKVYGIGERIFEQCAGFLRVGRVDPNDIHFYMQDNTTPLDATIIHPESYPIVRNILSRMNLREKDVGTENFIKNFNRRSAEITIDTLAETFKTNKETIKLIFEALSKTLDHDLRAEFNKTPLFKKSVQTMEELEAGTVLTGRVKNVTSFGSFVDIGVGRDGLVHITKSRGMTLHLGDVLEVEVLNIDRVKGHIQLKAVSRVID